MKIAFIVRNFPDTSETFILEQIKGLIKRNHDIQIFARRKPDHETQHPSLKNYDLLSKTTYFDIPDSKTKRLVDALTLLPKQLFQAPVATLKSLNFLKHGRTSLSLKGLYASQLFSREKQFDVVHCHFGWNGLLGSLLKESGYVSAKLITSFYGSDVTVYPETNGTNCYDTLFEVNDLILAECNHFRNRLIELGAPRDKVKLHRIGVNPDRFERKRRNTTEASTPDRVQLLSVSRLIECKGINYALKAVSQLRDSVDFSYKIVGQGPMLPQLKKLVNELNMKRIVTFEGPQPRDKVKQYMQNADIFLAPSVTDRDGRQDSTMMVLVEALATGLPVVTTDFPGIREIVTHQETGFLAPEKNVMEISEFIKKLIENPQLRKRFGEKGREIIREKFNVSKWNEKLVQRYNSLVRDNI